MSYRFKASETFWKKLYQLDEPTKASVRRAWKKFKNNPFDPGLRPHKIQALSSKAGKTIYSITIEEDLRVVFYIEEDTLHTVDIGTHAIYRV